ncbi:enhanced serine sensitivity protein SseB [Myroides sp. NP-2]|uniref:enhanced serine sensitivity protein SseB n=1 Tax=Myroides sp. NP-2 TaxID=2759945 RepID=UPI0015F89A68|nr:enhanced serine sensitivity protein SseB [Myroides sp. NP-2]MBB1149565.1 enhanced serine sensitivity protein SseB [Myroides sp. NP-2]
MTQPKQKALNKNLPLADIIEKAGTDKEYRAVFYEKFLKNDIYVLVKKEYNQANSFNANAPIITFENQHIPVFTAPKHIYDQGAIQDEMNYMKVNGRAFLELAMGHHIIVNPFSKVYKELVPNEIADMLNGSIFNFMKDDVAHLHMQALIGKPEIEPTALLQDLKITFASIPAIASAYIGWTFNERIDQKPHYIFAIDCEVKDAAGFKEIADVISNLCKPHLKKEDYIDIIRLEPKGNFSDYFYNEDQPFYTK